MASQSAKREGWAEEGPLVVVAKIDNALRLTAVDAKAAQMNLHTGMTLADARAMIPSLHIVEADDQADRKLLERIADWCDRYTPFVALDLPYGLLLDVTGVAHLFGGERALIELVRASIAKQGFAVKAALAGNAAAARALAHYAGGTIAESGKDAEAIASLPITALKLDADALHGLKRAGLKTIGAVAARTRAELAKRFGAGMVSLIDNALGKAEKPISPRRTLPDCMAEHRFPEPVVTEAVIAESLFSLGKTLAEILEKRGEGARALEASFYRADGVVRRIGIETGHPLRDPLVIQKLFRERLDSLADPLDPGFGFDLIRLEALRADRFDAQSSRLEESGDGKAEIAYLIDRLAARVGPQRVLAFCPLDSHIPEAASAAIPAQYTKPTKIAWQSLRATHEAPRRPLRMFAKPEPIDVMAEVPDGPPLRFRWRRMAHHVARADGPERIAMEWWRRQEPQPTRDYYRVEDDEGRRFWLYRDGLYGRETDRPRWYVHGVFA